MTEKKLEHSLLMQGKKGQYPFQSSEMIDDKNGKLFKKIPEHMINFKLSLQEKSQLDPKRCLRPFKLRCLPKVQLTKELTRFNM